MDVFHDSINRIERAAALYNAPTWLVEELSSPKNVFELKVRANTHKGKEAFEGVRVHQTNPYTTGASHPFKGGFRYMKYASKEEMIRAMRALANDMTLKNALCKLPFGGSKGCLNINPAEYSESELETITKELVIEMIICNILGSDKDVPGPDVGTNPQIMKYMYIQYGRLNQILHRPYPSAVVTGKPVEFDGIPGRADATSRGGLIIFRELVKPKQGLRIGIQGYGNVGANLHRLINLNEPLLEGIVIAVSEATSAIYNPKGISFEALSKYYQEHKNFIGCTLGEIIPPDDLLRITHYDLFVTCAKEGLLHGNNAHLLKAKTILELGNSAITSDADTIFAEQNTKVIPDILANPAGVIVSSFEWRKNRGDIYHLVDLRELEDWVYNELEKILKFCAKAVLHTQEEFKTDLRTAAHIVALRELEFLLRGKHGY